MVKNPRMLLFGKTKLCRMMCCMLLVLLSSLMTPAEAQFKVVGYLPTWAGSVSNIQFSKLTHVNYAFLIPTSNGGYQPIENASKLQSLVTAAHANGVKVLVSVGGGGGGDGFHGIVASSANRINFANNMLAFANQYNLDGIDIDWEYPSDGTEANNFLLMMQQLSTTMHNNGKLCTIAVIGNYGTHIVTGVFDTVDYLTIMAYDDNDYEHSTYNLAVQCMNYWRGRGVPAAKAILGVPFYGRPTWETYAQLLAKGADPYSDTYNGVGYNGITTIKNKTNLAFDQGGGIMMWELSGDVSGQYSLVSAINEVVINRGGGSVISAAPIGKTVSLLGVNAQYVTSNGAAGPIWCNATAVQNGNKFLIVDAGNGKVALRNQGKYVSSENGVNAMNCNRDTIGATEKFDWVANTNGSISLKGNNGLYVSSENGVKAMTCNRTAINTWEQFTVGVVQVAPVTQTIWLQGSNALYVSSENGTKAMNCNRSTPQGWEQFLVADAGNGKVTLQSMGKYVSSENGAQAMTCNRATPQGWEQFDWLVNADNTISLRGSNGLYVSSENGTKEMTCNRTSIQGWEKFNYGNITTTTRVATAAFNIPTDNTPGIIYPNPVQKGSKLTVSVKQYNANALVHVTVIDISGKTLAQYKTGNGSINIPVKYRPGTYFVKIENAGNSYVQKLIVQ
ncbi:MULTISPECIES: glycosyl hydrolase family 18 protein [Niastella]|uniref:chitinase n=1 Tax=Niastella soli TaxID=2821487 RepID=A0ABS3Z428_9BACT|nr:glycosyl hydrolase family 18 protein [Niastella soli]MBO9204793.1 T9SS type A sorting domain-containing protein [Niastella soli]